MDFTEGIPEKKKELVTSLSGGQYRRLQLARIFLCDAKVYFLDEPSLGLDYQAKESFWRFLRTTCKETGVTIVIATNDLIEAEQMCDRIAFLNKGKMVALDSPGELERLLNKIMIDVQFDNMQDISTLLESKSKVVYDQVENIKGTCVQFRHNRNGSSLSEFIQELEKIGNVQSFSMHQPTLQDVFLELMKKEIQ